MPGFSFRNPRTLRLRAAGPGRVRRGSRARLMARWDRGNSNVAAPAMAITAQRRCEQQAERSGAVSSSCCTVARRAARRCGRCGHPIRRARRRRRQPLLPSSCLPSPKGGAVGCVAVAAHVTTATTTPAQPPPPPPTPRFCFITAVPRLLQQPAVSEVNCHCKTLLNVTVIMLLK